MRKTFLLARSDFRRAKGQTLTLFVLIFLAALMLNLWLVLSFDYRQNFDRYHDRLNAEHAVFVIYGNSTEMDRFLEDTLEADKETKEYSLDESIFEAGGFDYRGSELRSAFIFMDRQTALSRPVGKVEIVESGTEKSGIYMPMYFKTEDIAIGKDIEITIGSQTVTYPICGFFNSIMAGSNNCGMIELVLTKDRYDELKEAGFTQSTLCSVRIDNKEQSEHYEAAINKAVSEKYPDACAASNSYLLVSTSRYISQIICSGIMCAMACFILLIAFVVTASNITNYIQDNMKNIGALKAAGYTSRELVFSFLFRFLGITVVAVVCGIGISYVCFPYVNTLMVEQTGIPYQVKFLPHLAFFALFVICGAVAAVVWLSSWKLKNIEPVTALRQGIHTHSFKRNFVPLEKTKLPFQFALALKTTCEGIRDNIIVCITMFVLSLIVVFSGMMIRNVIMDMTQFIYLVVGEMADSLVYVSADAEEDFLQEMRADERVEKVYLFHTMQVTHGDGALLTVNITDDFSVINNQNIACSGRCPEYENEIALAAKYAKEQQLGIGNEITIAANGKKETYVITGLVQNSNNMGKDCLLTRAGYERMGKLQEMGYSMNLKAGTDIDAFNAGIKSRFGEHVIQMVNMHAQIESTSTVYVTLIKMIVAAVSILSIIIIVFVLHLLVKTLLGKKKQDYGILKALGFTTGQLVVQTAFSFMPAVILSTIASIIICCFIINPLIAWFLRDLGIVKCTFTVPIPFIAAAAAALVLFAFASACLMSYKIKKIVPRTMLARE